MSHVFISYSRKDRDKLERLVEKLKVSGFSEDNDIWYDKHMKAGDDWRDEIETKLKEAFVVAVIVTRKAMCSTYVTYEWSWALGNGTPVVPLLFEDLRTTQIHARLSMINYRNCIHDISDDVPETLKGYMQIPPDIVHINGQIQEDITNTRVMSRVSLWLYRYAQEGKCDEAFCRILMGKIASEIKKSQLGLTKLMIYASHAFTSRQKRKCRELTENLRRFWEMYHKQVPSDVEDSYILRSRYTLDDINQMEEFRAHHLEPLFSYFTNEKGKDNKFYAGLDKCLSDISAKQRSNDFEFGDFCTAITIAFGLGSNETNSIIETIYYARNHILD